MADKDNFEKGFNAFMAAMLMKSIIGDKKIPDMINNLPAVVMRVRQTQNK